MPKHRIQLDLDDEALQEWDDLLKEAGFPNRAEMVRQALRYLQWSLTETKKGSSIILEKEGKVREVIFPFWVVNQASGQ